MNTEIIEMKCDENLKVLLPFLKNSIDNPELSLESYETSTEESEGSESFDSEIYNFDKQLNDEQIIFLLNTIGQTYLPKDGFCENEPVRFNDKFDKNLVTALIEESKEESYYIDESLDGKLNVDINFFMEKALITLPYTKVIIQYNLDCSISCKYDEKWIKVDNKSKQIILSRKDKKLTIDDILYATREIATVYNSVYREVNFMVQISTREFKVLSNNDNVLLLRY